MINLRNKHIALTLSEYGATILELKRVKDNIDLAVPITEQEAKGDNFECHGAIMGPSSGRICSPKVTMNDNTYIIKDFDKCLLHSGEKRIHHNKWTLVKSTDTSALFKFHYINDELPFLSNQEVEVKYELEGKKVKCQIKSTSDDYKIMNYTNHTYFSLGEEDSRNILLKGEILQEIETNDSLITGKILDLSENGWDFSAYQTYKQLDFPFVLGGKVSLKGQNSNIELDISSNQEAVVIYNDCFSLQKRKFKGLAIEMQGYPDAINHGHFPQNVFKERVNEIVFEFKW